MTIFIPEWILWLLGGAGIFVILMLAVVGVAFCWAFKDGFKISW